ncbi:hypothetical protein DFH06DRAFT_1348669 [Mycena polygramma]|nr:hypothetical protein DFH06DRAFT_1348669 [Mycena polygramma]
MYQGKDKKLGYRNVWTDRENHRQLHFGRWEPPAGVVDFEHFGAPVPRFPFYHPGDGNVVLPRPASHWMYPQQQPLRGDAGREPRPPHPNQLPLLEDAALPRGAYRDDRVGRVIYPEDHDDCESEYDEGSEDGMEVDTPRPESLASNVVVLEGLNERWGPTEFHRLVDGRFRSERPRLEPIAIIRAQRKMWVRFGNAAEGRRAFGVLGGSGLGYGVVLSFAPDDEFVERAKYTREVWPPIPATEVARAERPLAPLEEGVSSLGLESPSSPRPQDLPAQPASTSGLPSAPLPPQYVTPTPVEPVESAPVPVSPSAPSPPRSSIFPPAANTSREIEELRSGNDRCERRPLGDPSVVPLKVSVAVQASIPEPPQTRLPQRPLPTGPRKWREKTTNRGISAAPPPGSSPFPAPSDQVFQQGTKAQGGWQTAGRPALEHRLTEPRGGVLARRLRSPIPRSLSGEARSAQSLIPLPLRLSEPDAQSLVPLPLRLSDPSPSLASRLLPAPTSLQLAPSQEVPVADEPPAKRLRSESSTLGASDASETPLDPEAPETPALDLPGDSTDPAESAEAPVVEKKKARRGRRSGVATKKLEEKRARRRAEKEALMEGVQASGDMDLLESMQVAAIAEEEEEKEMEELVAEVGGDDIEQRSAAFWDEIDALLADEGPRWEYDEDEEMPIAGPSH